MVQAHRTSMLTSATLRKRVGATTRGARSDLPVVVVDGVMSAAAAAECVTAVGGMKWSTSTVTAGTGRGRASDTRTSSTLALHFLTSTPAALTAPQRVLKKHLGAAITKVAGWMGLTPLHVEVPQLTRYTKGQEFMVHHDTASIEYDEDTRDAVITANDGHAALRVFTAFLYLTDNDARSGTWFPRLRGADGEEVVVQPRAGRVALWQNVCADGMPDPDAAHAGLPAVAGETKIGMNMWFVARR